MMTMTAGLCPFRVGLSFTALCPVSPMFAVRCPICDKLMNVDHLADWPSFPFCSRRCRTIDLGRWLDGRYVLPNDNAEAESAFSPDEEST